MTEAWATNGAAATEHVSLGALDLISNASLMVQLVLLSLIGLSILSWAIIFTKWGVVRRALASTERFLDIFWSGKSMDHIYNESKRLTNSSLSKIFQSGYIELQKLIEKERLKSSSTDPQKLLPQESAIDNLERAVARAARSESLRLERSLTFLATTGSTAPFIGLFGTVWGIMNAFQNIGAQGSASLATVAPGIAEALIATAVGLLCAIPAVMAYNYFVQKVRGLKTQMENFSGDFLNIIRRNFLVS